jgi:hypothetical protein
MQPYFDALTKLSDMLPASPEGKKLVLGLALSAAGVNDVDQVLGNLFPPLPEGAKPTQPQPMQQAPGMLQQGPPVPKQIGAGNGEPNPPNPSQQREALAPERVHRFLRAVREASASYPVVEGEYTEVS